MRDRKILVETTEHKEHEIKVSIDRGDYHREIVFKFRDGKMLKPVHNFPYTKTRWDWEFYMTAIDEMLKESKKFYPEDNPEDYEIPF